MPDQPTDPTTHAAWLRQQAKYAAERTVTFITNANYVGAKVEAASIVLLLDEADERDGVRPERNWSDADVAEGNSLLESM